MYESLKAWCKQDITVERPGALLPSGESGPGSTFTVKGFVVDDTKLITDKNGQLYQCRQYAYIIPDPKVEPEDKIRMPTNNKACEIRKLGGYYDGNDGKLSVQVIYL